VGHVYDNVMSCYLLCKKNNIKIHDWVLGVLAFSYGRVLVKTLYNLLTEDRRKVVVDRSLLLLYR
jgi:hypothetical protein